MCNCVDWVWARTKAEHETSHEAWVKFTSVPSSSPFYWRLTHHFTWYKEKMWSDKSLEYYFIHQCILITHSLLFTQSNLIKSHEILSLVTQITLWKDSWDENLVFNCSKKTLETFNLLIYFLLLMLDKHVYVQYLILFIVLCKETICIRPFDCPVSE